MNDHAPTAVKRTREPHGTRATNDSRIQRWIALLASACLLAWALIPVAAGPATRAVAQEKPIETFDLVIYGATPGGIGAAVQASRMGRKSVILEASGHLGGMTTGGLGATDFGNKDVIGGISREFYQTLGRFYDKPEAWTFEPHKAMAVYRDWVRNPSITLLLNQPLDLKDGVHKRDGRILWIRGSAPKVAGGSERRFSSIHPTKGICWRGRGFRSMSGGKPTPFMARHSTASSSAA